MRTLVSPVRVESHAAGYRSKINQSVFFRQQVTSRRFSNISVGLADVGAAVPRTKHGCEQTHSAVGARQRKVAQEAIHGNKSPEVRANVAGNPGRRASWSQPTSPRALRSGRASSAMICPTGRRATSIVSLAHRYRRIQDGLFVLRAEERHAADIEAHPPACSHRD